MNIIVLGGGASGILAALKASDKNDVTIIEANEKIGKKLLITGNGHCNFWNESIDITKYNSENKEILEDLLLKKDEVYSYLTKTLGIYPTNKDGYIYPYSKSSNSFVEVLKRELAKRNIEVLYNLKVKELKEVDEKVEISLADNSRMYADKVIIALGSKSASKTGSDGSGYEILNKLGIQTTPISASLVPLITDDKDIKEWAGVRTNAKIKVTEDNNLIKEETGEIQLTEYGISGIVTFNISSIVSKYLLTHKTFMLTIDFIPDIDNLIDMLESKKSSSNANSIEELLESIFNYKLMNVILKKANLKKDKSWDNLTNAEKLKLVNIIKDFELNIVKTEDYEKSQVTRGGIPLTEINNSFRLKKYKRISVVGEILDVDGICGGYNLAFAFISGYIAGDEIND